MITTGPARTDPSNWISNGGNVMELPLVSERICLADLLAPLYHISLPFLQQFSSPSVLVKLQNGIDNIHWILRIIEDGVPAFDLKLDWTFFLRQSKDGHWTKHVCSDRKNLMYIAFHTGWPVAMLYTVWWMICCVLPADSFWPEPFGRLMDEYWPRPLICGPRIYSHCGGKMESATS